MWAHAESGENRRVIGAGSSGCSNRSVSAPKNASSRVRVTRRCDVHLCGGADLEHEDDGFRADRARMECEEDSERRALARPWLVWRNRLCRDSERSIFFFFASGSVVWLLTSSASPPLALCGTAGHSDPKGSYASGLGGFALSTVCRGCSERTKIGAGGKECWNEGVVCVCGGKSGPAGPKLDGAPERPCVVSDRPPWPRCPYAPS